MINRISIIIEMKFSCRFLFQKPGSLFLQQFAYDHVVLKYREDANCL